MLNPHFLLLLAPALGGSDPVPAPEPGPTVVGLADEPVLDEWVGSVSVGAIVTTGNTETRSASATADGEYRRAKDRTTLGAFWNYQDDDTGVTQRRAGAKAQYDYFFSPKTYGLAQTRVESDYEADLDLRLIFGVGIGRQFLDGDVHKFKGEAGLSWFDENYGNSPDESYLAARFAYGWDWFINKDWTFNQTGEIYPSLEDAEDLYTKLDSRLKVALTGKMFAQAQWVMDWDNTPAAGKERMDNRYLLTLGWTF
jgi:putative salt-induced outer membrane protein YdiY